MRRSPSSRRSASIQSMSARCGARHQAAGSSDVDGGVQVVSTAKRSLASTPLRDLPARRAPDYWRGGIQNTIGCPHPLPATTLRPDPIQGHAAHAACTDGSPAAAEMLSEHAVVRAAPPGGRGVDDGRSQCAREGPSPARQMLLESSVQPGDAAKARLGAQRHRSEP